MIVDRREVEIHGNSSKTLYHELRERTPQTRLIINCKMGTRQRDRDEI